MNELLKLTLQVGVPLTIARLNSAGGPTEADWNRAKEFGSNVLPHKGDVLLYGSKRKGETAELVNSLVHALAVMSFVPGGSRFANLEFHARGREAD